jgi:hypothetical protein
MSAAIEVPQHAKVVPTIILAGKLPRMPTSTNRVEPNPTVNIINLWTPKSMKSDWFISYRAF